MSKDFSELLTEFKNREAHINSNPAVIYIESVKGCPFSCAMCKTTPAKPQRISEPLLKKIEPFFKDLEVLTIHGFGEPLLADLDYFVEQSAKHDFVLHMNTTGALLTKKRGDLLLQTRLSIRFSIHAGSPKTYEKIIGGNLNKVREKILYLVQRGNDSGKNHDFWFSFIVMKENIDEIEDFLRFAQECGIKSVRFMHLDANWRTLRGARTRGFRFNHFEQFNKKIINEFFSNLPRYKELAQELDITIEWGSIQRYAGSNIFGQLGNDVTNTIFGRMFFPLNPRKGVCAAPWIGQLSINQAGNVRLCCSSAYSLGNLKETTLDAIWHSDKMKKIRNSFSKGCYPHICGYCKGFDFNEYPKNSFDMVPRT
jgi:MoaA/NifB/PqqE/SkfB family radical SAM enzyme